jgi:RNA polymerase primary sigma factor
MKPTSEKHPSVAASAAPKFVDHDELHGRQAYERLFGPISEEDRASAKEERDLRRFKQMHFCARKMKTLLKQYGRKCTCLKEFRRFAQMHQHLRDGIASDNLGLVYDLYKRSRIVNVDGDELLSEGMMALTRAINTFDPWRGFRFSTYACNAIVRAFYRCGLKESRRRQHEPLNFESELERSDWADTQRSEESHLYVERLSRILDDDKAELTPIEKDVLARRFPFDGRVERLTLSDIGKRMNLSKERVRQIQNSALGKLRTALDADALLV